MKTVILDDDPTGTQSAAEVTVLLAWNAEAMLDVLRREDAVYLQTNSRSLDEESAVAVANRIRHEVAHAETSLGLPVTVVLRGDSTLRGHVVAETAVFSAEAPVLFVPAFPDAGRRTRNGEHFVTVTGIDVPASETEFAADPVFGYGTSRLIDFVQQAGGPKAIGIDLADLRAEQGEALDRALSTALPGTFVIPDVELTSDLFLIAQVVHRRRERGETTVVRCAAPLAAMIAGCYSDQLLASLLPRRAVGVVVVCGSHTSASSAQLARLTERLGAPVRTVSTDVAMKSTWDAARPVASAAKRDLAVRGIAVIASERERRDGHGHLSDGSRVMAGLVSAVHEVRDRVDTVVTKGGITAAEVVRQGLGARTARVLGAAFVGVPVWRLGAGSRGETVVIVPGNIGDPDLLATAVRRVLAS